VEPVRKRLVVHGRVQGVFFRDTARRLAEQRGVAGWARNLPDGTVEVVLEGDPTAVDELVRYAREGPRGAQVERVDESDEPAEGLSGFMIS
jgi:acylphosphatase